MASHPCSCASPLSPVERDLTAVMPISADAHAASFDAAAHSAVAELPHNTSSWELLDIAAATAPADSDGACATGVAAGLQVEERAAAAPAILTEAAAGCRAALEGHGPMQSPLGTAGAAGDGRVSPASTEGSEWSLVSTPRDAALVSGAPPAAAARAECDAPLREGTHREARQRRSRNRQTDAGSSCAAKAAAAVDSRCISQSVSLASLASSLPSRHAGWDVSAADGGWSTTSYEEVCMADVVRGSPGRTRVDAVLGGCGAGGRLKSGDSVQDGHPAAEEQKEGSGESKQGAWHGGAACADSESRAAQSDTCPPSTHRPGVHGPPLHAAPSRAWASTLRHAVHDGLMDCLPPHCSRAAVGRDNGAAARRSALWTARRLSFLSSSLSQSTASAITLSTGFPSIPVSTAGCQNGGTGTGHHHPKDDASAFFCFSSSSSSLFAQVSTQWWSWTRLRCVDGSQHALRGFHRLCDYVWMDLKEHWYPQLRLVLGDHSRAQKVRRVQGARHRLSHKKSDKTKGTCSASGCGLPSHAARPTETRDGVTVVAAPGMPARSWRSVSAPCLVNGQSRVLSGESTRPSNQQRGEGECVRCSRKRSRSSRGGLKRCYAMTAEAVASAAQGLLVFLI